MRTENVSWHAHVQFYFVLIESFISREMHMETDERMHLNPYGNICM